MREEDIEHNNQSVLLETPAGFREEALVQVMEALYRRHDALRLRFEKAAGGEWKARHAELTTAMVEESCVVESLLLAEANSGQEQREQREFREFVEERCGHYQKSLDIEKGPVLRAVYLKGKAGKAGRLFVVVHHLVVDGVSWRVLLSDLEQGYGQWREGQRIELGRKSSSYQQWGEELKKYGESEELEKEREYWRKSWEKEAGAGNWAVVPRGSEAGEQARFGSTRRVGLGLNEEETRRLLQESTSAYRSGINELLLAGVYWGLREWSGERVQRVMLEGHGREELFAGVDTTETVGCFTTLYPVVLEAPNPNATQNQNKSKSKSKPGHGRGDQGSEGAVPQCAGAGIGYGLLRYGMDREQLEAAEKQQGVGVLFNYLGQLDQTLGEGAAFGIGKEATGESVDPERKRGYVVGLNGMVGGGELRFQLNYSSQQYDEEEMKRLGEWIEQGWREVIGHCRQVGQGEYTPSDFPLARIGQERLDQWQRKYQIEKLYPATAMQKGMLFHGLLEGEAYISQLYPRLRGAVDGSKMRVAWEGMVERHGVFRTVFVGEGEEQHQLVVRQAQLEWHEEDWRGLSAEEQERRFEEYRKQEKEQRV